MKKLELILLAETLCFSLAGLAMAYSNASHTVTVTVIAINEVRTHGANAILTTDGYDNITCALKWTSSEANQKITVATHNSTSNFALKGLPKSVIGVTAANEATLSTTATDFILGLSKITGCCNLRYTAKVRIPQRTETHAYSFIYTITDA
jgi:hypothetical protein